MKTLANTISLLMLICTINLSAQNIDNHLFKGEVRLDQEKGDGVKISVLQDGIITSSYETKRNSKFSFVSGIEHFYTLIFEKEGYRTEQVLISTQDTYTLERYPKAYSLNINLKKIDENETQKVAETARYIEYNHYLEKFTGTKRIPVDQMAALIFSENKLAAQVK